MAPKGRRRDPRLLHNTPEDVFIHICSFLEHPQFVCELLEVLVAAKPVHIHLGVGLM